MIAAIDDRIIALKKELIALIDSHQKTVTDYQAEIARNQNRYQQLHGAIAELETLKNSLNGQSSPTPHEHMQPERFA